MIQLKTLVQIASATGIIVAATGYGFRYKIQNEIRESEPYKEAIKYLHNHEKALELLGTPVVEGRVNISNRDDYGSNDNIGWMQIPIKGSQRKGTLRIEMIIDPKDIELEILHVYKMELKVDNLPGRIFVLKDDSELLKDIVKKN